MNEQIKETIIAMNREDILKVTGSDLRDKNYEYKRTIGIRINEATPYFQVEKYTQTQVFHENISINNIEETFYQLTNIYKQFHVITRTSEYQLRISKKGKIHLVKKQVEEALVKKAEKNSHNKKKQYILPQDEPVDFLIELGIMDKEGKIRDKKWDKFKQINKYLEFIEDVYGEIETQVPTIIDFGCGKSYLTFALYYYLVKMRKKKCRIIGLDLKEKVIEDLKEIKNTLGYDDLEFYVGDIKEYEADVAIDMVISLHACDTATDYAIAKGIDWKAKVILAVPCCHKEVYRSIQKNAMEPIFKYGLLKERISALMTDGIRAEILTAKGYEVDVMEFIPLEHTPKNIMIRAVKKKQPKEVSKQYKELIETFEIQSTLEKLVQ